MSSWKTRAVAVGLLCALHAPRARAQEPASASPSGQAPEADESFRAGRELLRDKRYAEACAKFELSQRQDPASATLLALAYCQELSGLLASSWSSYQAAAELAAHEGQPDRQTAATERAQALSTRFSKLTVAVSPALLALPELHVLRDGRELERTAFGKPLPVDGGTYAFQATATGRVPWSGTILLLAEQDEKTLVLPMLGLAEPPPAPAPTRAPKAVLAPEAGHELAYKRVSLGLAAASVVGVAVGTAYALAALSRKDESNADGHCGAEGCDPRGVELRNSALSAARVSTWSFVASGALAACSLTLYIAAGSSGPSSGTSARLVQNHSLGAPGLAVSGSF